MGQLFQKKWKICQTEEFPANMRYVYENGSRVGVDILKVTS